MGLSKLNFHKTYKFKKEHLTKHIRSFVKTKNIAFMELKIKILK